MEKEIFKYFEKSKHIGNIDKSLYKANDVKNGLRNYDGTGVLVGLTKISDVVGYKIIDNKKVDCEGDLLYRGISIADLIHNHDSENRYLFEEVSFLILFGFLPNKKELENFKQTLANGYELPEGYLRASILYWPSRDMMNKLQQEVLKLYSYDETPDNTEVENLLTKGINLVSKLPIISTYAYQTKIHYFDDESLVIHHVRKDLSIAENILYLLRKNGNFTKREADILDKCLVLHADHGGSNNSTFTSSVISSTGTDIYSSVAGAVGSLKGPKHGGANAAVLKQMQLIIKDIGLDASDDQIKDILRKILNKEYNDNKGLIYGIGHAVYTLSDPRAKLLSEACRELAIEKNRLHEFEFYNRVEKLSIELIKEVKGINVCANVDFYSGLIYNMLCIPTELFTTIFAIGRSVGWVAHIIEMNLYSGKIIRPASKFVGSKQPYIDIEDR